MSSWDLSVLYTGIDSEEFKGDVEKLINYVEMADILAKNINQKEELETLKSILTYLQKFNTLTRRIFSYLNLRQATDTTNPEVTNTMNQCQTLLVKATGSFTIINQWIGSRENLDQLIEQDSFIKEHAFYLKEIASDARHLLSDREEEIIGRIHLDGGNNWEKLQEYMTSTVQVDYEGETVPLSGIRNLAYSRDTYVRKSAYEAEIKSYDKIKDAVAFSLNSIKGEVNTIAELRGYSSPIEMTLEKSRMKQETLDALLGSIQKYLPKFREYLVHKSKLLGYSKGLPWYELFAPIGLSSKEYSLEDARKFIVANFKTFSDDLAELVERAFTENWIDFFPKPKKVGGAFCANLPIVKQSRILTNYDYSLSDVLTLAHELGHAYHGYMIQDHSILNTRYTMPVAETASIFCETIVMNASLKNAANEEKILLLESSIQDLTQTIVDIYSRYLFEKEVFEKRKSEFLFSADLEQIMLDAQKEAYGNGLDEECMHPFMWVCKSHYYSTSLSYYNFPYAFGALFAKGLYAQYLKEGESFVEKYKGLLRATTVKNVEEVAAMADIDITKQDFWNASLEMVSEMIDEFIELTQ